MIRKVMSIKIFKLQLSTWIIFILLSIVLAALIKTVLFYPRKNWSLEEPWQGAKVEKEASQTRSMPQDVRRIVLISIDTCRADHLGCYGYSRNTSPNIDALARDGVLFNHVVTPVPITLPSHSSILTGKSPLGHRVHDNNNYRLGSSNDTIAELLQDKGFVTGAIIGAFVLDAQFGLDQGFDTYDDDLSDGNPTSLFYNERKGEEVSHLANLWLKKHRDDDFFLFLHYFDPHFPYRFHRGFHFSSFPFLVDKRDLYDMEIAYTDYCVGQVIKKLKDLNLYDSTLIIITADHGEGLGEHSETSHGFFIYHSSVHVPLVIKAPLGPKGLIIKKLAGLIDIAPTICGSVGILPSADMEGKDLNRYFSSKDDIVEDRYIYCESLWPTKFGLRPLFGLVNDRWKYIYSGQPEIYDLSKDSHETKNVADERSKEINVMQEKLKLILGKNAIIKSTGNKVSMDKETLERLGSLGYMSGRIVDEDLNFEEGVGSSNPEDYIETYKFMARYYNLVSEQNFKKAKALCMEMLERWPDMRQIHYFLGDIAACEKDYKGMVNHYQRYLTKTDSGTDPDMHDKPVYDYALAHNSIGVAMLRQGQTQQAIPHLKKAISYNPYLTSIYCDLASIYLSQGRLYQAITYCSKALEIDPDLPNANLIMGDVLLKQKKFKKAILYLTKALELKPDWPEAKWDLNIAKQSLKEERSEDKMGNQP